MNRDDEYTDYSCSTSMERLSRDVETLLRRWHLDGSDRHVSFVSSANSSAFGFKKKKSKGGGGVDWSAGAGVGGITPTSSKRRNVFSRRKSKSSPAGMDDSGSIHSAPVRRKGKKNGGVGGPLANPLANSPSSHGGTQGDVRLIREAKVSWVVSTSSSKVTIPLTLTLWDGPSLIDGDDDDDDDASDLPYSLRRLVWNDASHQTVVSSTYHDLSTLLGIGQHLVLCLRKDGNDSPLEALEWTIMEKRRQEQQHNGATTTSTTTTTSSITTMLQTALHCAALNMNCSIPAFAIWGIYKPPTKGEVPLFIAQQASSNLLSAYPSWLRLMPSHQQTRGQQSRGLFRTGGSGSSPRKPNYLPPILTSTLLSGKYSFRICLQPTTSTTTALPNGTRAPNEGITKWAPYLGQLCGTKATSVMLCGAKHVYRWDKPPKRMFPRMQALLHHEEYNLVSEWRTWPIIPPPLSSKNSHAQANDNITYEEYRRACRQHAVRMLEQAAAHNLSSAEPMWGSLDDPILGITAEVTWKQSRRVPTLLKTRQSSMSRQDREELEMSLERNLLDPLLPHVDFTISTTWDRDTSVGSMAASMRLLLAGFIRMATLPSNIMLQHLTSDFMLMDDDDDDTSNSEDEEHMDRTNHTKHQDAAATWSQRMEAITTRILNATNVSPTTRRLVDAMDFSSMADDMMEVSEAEQLVQDLIWNAGDGALFPNPPATKPGAPPPEKEDEAWYLRKSARPGRLLTILFTHMCRLRSPSSMALLWMSFVEELRKRWESRDAFLPDMIQIPGLDRDRSGEQTRGFVQIGLKADYSAFIHSTFPDPDVQNKVLVGQKLQVFQLGMELSMAIQRQEDERKRQRRLDASFVTASRGSIGGEMTSSEFSVPLNDTTPKSRNAGARRGRRGEADNDSDDEDSIMNDAATTATFVTSAPMDQSFQTSTDGALVIGRSRDETDDEHSVGSFRTTRTTETAYFTDAGDMDDDSDDDDVGLTGNLDDYMIMGSDVEGANDDDDDDKHSEDSGDFGIRIPSPLKGRIQPQQQQQHQQNKRVGARCPVFGLTLVDTGDQVYAPYLQRSYPITADVMLERRLLVSPTPSTPTSTPKLSPSTSSSSSFVGGGMIFSSSTQSRVEIAHRLQRPKLLSDMSAFRAANPGAVFQDFINWYGNPGNPLEDYNDTVEEPQNTGSLSPLSANVAVKLDNASEAIQVLTSTRDFWSKTWEEATPCAAIDQEPLFDVESTVEMVLDYLDHVHPASLLNQIMAVNLSMAYFHLRVAAVNAELLRIRVVDKALKQLKERTQHALDLMNRDVIHGTVPGADKNQQQPRVPKHASLEAIRACDDACDALAATEIAICRSMSLLHKFPGQYDLVHNMLRRTDQETIALPNPEGRRGILSAISRQQYQTTVDQPIPSLREYVLRNTNDSKPCQLFVRHKAATATTTTKSNDKEDGSGLMIALTQSHF